MNASPFPCLLYGLLAFVATLPGFAAEEMHRAGASLAKLRMRDSFAVQGDLFSGDWEIEIYRKVDPETDGLRGGGPWSSSSKPYQPIHGSENLFLTFNRGGLSYSKGNYFLPNAALPKRKKLVEVYIEVQRVSGPEIEVKKVRGVEKLFGTVHYTLTLTSEKETTVDLDAVAPGLKLGKVEVTAKEPANLKFHRTVSLVEAVAGKRREAR